MSVLKINKDNFEEVVLKSEKAVLIDFYADWCGPCKMIEPFVAEIAEENPDVVVGKVNVDEEMELAIKFGVQSIPALFVVKDGKIKDSAIGFKPKEVLLEMLK